MFLLKKRLPAVLQGKCLLQKRTPDASQDMFLLKKYVPDVLHGKCLLQKDTPDASQEIYRSKKCSPVTFQVISTLKKYTYPIYIHPIIRLIR